jgi:hypothetical protein
MARAKFKRTTKPSRLPVRREKTAGQLYKEAIPRMEQMIATLESCFVTEGWHERWKSGPMPKLAADVIAYSRARAGGAREDAAEEAKLNAFIDSCGQSLDWIFDGNVGGLICKAAPIGGGYPNHRKPSQRCSRCQPHSAIWKPRFFRFAIWRSRPA